MLRRLTTLGAAIGALLVAAPASAQPAAKFGDQGEFIFSADRLFGVFAYDQATFSDGANNTSSTITGSSFSFFGGPNAFVAGGTGGTARGVGPLQAGYPTPYTLPRLGFDYTIIPNLTLGGNIVAFFTVGGSNSTTGNPSVNNPSGDLFGIAPRVGYIFNLSDVISIWLRGGPTLYLGNVNANQPHPNTPCDNSYGFDLFGLGVDPQLVISPIPHTAFEVGPAFDWGFAGNTNNSNPNQGCNVSTSYGYTSLAFAINAGLMFWL